MAFILVRSSHVSGLVSKVIKSNKAYLTLESASRSLSKDNYSFKLPGDNGNKRHLSCLHKSLLSSVDPVSYLHIEQLNIDKDILTVPIKPLQGTVHTVKRFKKGRINFPLGKIQLLKNLEHKLAYNELYHKYAFILLKSCGRTMENETNSTRTELVEHVWEELGKKGVERNTALWNTLLSVHNENKHELDPLLFLKNMWEVSGIEPNRSTFKLLLQSCAQRGDVIGAMKIFEFIVKDSNIHLTEDLYAWVLFAFAKNKDVDGVNNILATMEEVGIEPTETTYISLIKAKAECGDVEAIDRIINDMVSKSIYPTTTIYMDILKHLVEGDHHELYGDALKRMDLECWPQELIASLIQYCITNNKYESALKLVLHSDKQTGSGDGYKYHVGVCLFQKMLHAKKTPEDYLQVVQLLDKHFSTMMEVNGSLGHFIQFSRNHRMTDDAIKTLQCALSESDVITRDIVQSFNFLLRNLVDAKDVSNILQVLRFMIDNGIQPSSSSHKKICTLISSSSVDQISLLAELKCLGVPASISSGRLRQLCKESDVKLDRITEEVSNAQDDELFGCMNDIKTLLLLNFDSPESIPLVLSLQRRGIKLWGWIEQIIGKATGKDDTKEVYCFLSSLVNENFVISSFLYTKMLSTLFDNNLDDEFYTFVQLMGEQGINPNSHQYYQMLKMSSKVGNSTAAKHCFDKLVKDERFQNKNIYDLLITAYYRDKEAQNCIEETSTTISNISNEMIEKGYEPTNRTKSMVLETLILAKGIDRAEEIFKEYSVKQHNFEFDLNGFQLAVHVSHKEFVEAEELFQKMKERSSVTLKHYNELMKMGEVTGDTAKIEELYDEMLSSDIKPNVETLYNRVQTHLKSKQPEQCVDIIEEYIEKGNKGILYVIPMLKVLSNLKYTGNVEYVSKMINAIKKYYPNVTDIMSNMTDNNFNTDLILTHIKAGDLDEATFILNSNQETVSDKALQLYRNVAKKAAYLGDEEYKLKIIGFMEMNNLPYHDMAKNNNNRKDNSQDGH